MCGHVPVLLKEAIDCLDCVRGGTFVDCTIGMGGHARAILEGAGPTSRLIGIDADPQALRRAKDALANWQDRVTLVHDNFQDLRKILEDLGIKHVDGVLFDLGLSSAQLHNGSRGFSFHRPGPLDMRFDPRQRLTAAEIVNRYPEKEIMHILREFGEERAARKIASAIVRRRKEMEISSTTELAGLVGDVLGRGQRRIHPATRTFQSLRIAVNRELEALRVALPQAISALRPGGRLVAISYHSLEDRIVKETFREYEKGCVCPPSFPECRCGRVSEVRILTRKPTRPCRSEVERNPRSRSARMRVCERKGKNDAM